MSNKSGTSDQVLSLPKGGGAIKGIGETFQPNLFSGTGNFSIPIFTSPGRSGFGPQLTLQYSTGNGNGPFGLGWQLSIPRITRKTEKGLPKYTDKDVFVMSGAEDLVPIPGAVSDPPPGYKITRYRPRTEGLFARIEKCERAGGSDKGDIHWRVTTKENVTSIYGRTAHARKYDPDNEDHIYEWLLQETFDAKGNHILYEYIREAAVPGVSGIFEQNRTYDSQVYIRRIYYGNTPDDSSVLPVGNRVGPDRTGTDHKNPLSTRKRHYLFEILFDYGDLNEDATSAYTKPCADDQQETTAGWAAHTNRSDPFSSFRASFEIRTLRRCRRALMVHHFKELGGPTIVKSTDFTYDSDPQTRLSILSSATVKGYRKEGNIYKSAKMPPVEFKYTQFKPHKQRYKSVTARGNDMPPRSLKDPQTTLVDLFGDGLPDVLNTTATGYYFWQNLGDGQLDMRQPQHTVPAGIILSQPGVAFGDMGGDGMADLVVQWPEMAGFYEATPDGNWKTFKKFKNYPSFSLADPNVRLIDLTGDGRSDVLMTRDMHFLWFECLGEEGYAEPMAVMREHNLDEFPDVYFNDPSGRVRLADMTGDGLNDIVLLHNGRIDYWPNLGYGKFGKRITMKGSPRLEYNFDPGRLFLADLDGSGSSDLVYVDTGKVHFWFNRSGNGWSDEQVIHGTPPVTDLDSVQFADIFGTGTATLVWSYDYGRYPGENYKALDFCGGVKPYVLNEMTNNMGATTKVQYAPSTKFYLEDKENGTPWATNLPFPVQVVETVEVIDHISKTKLVTTYKYHHGYYDGREREFRGFGRVDQFDTETFDDFTQPGLHGDDQLFTNDQRAFHVPPVETRTWYHTGVYYDEDRPAPDGSPFDHHTLMDLYKKEFYNKDPKAFDMGDHLFIADPNTPPTDTPHEIFRALRGAMLRTEIYARDNTDKSDHPYVVTQNRYLVTEIQPKGHNPHAVYLTTQKESLSYHYERNPDDPRVGHNITLSVDKFGNVTDKISIGYPRRKVPSDRPEQGELKILYIKADFINKPNEKDFYFVGVPWQRKSFEVTGIKWSWERPSSLTEEAFASLMQDSNFESYWDFPQDRTMVKKRIVEWTRTYFRDNNNPHEIDRIGVLNHRLPRGEINSLGLPYETYQAAFTSIDELKEQFKDGGDADPNRFRIKFNIDGNILVTDGGYHTGESDYPDYWWVPSGRQGFNKDKFYLPEQTQDPFENRSSVTYDTYGLLMTKAVDPLSNTIEARNNYRLLQPYAVTDPNQNLSVVRFDELGFVVATAAMGKKQNDGTWEGDFLDPDKPEPQPADVPTTILEYDFFQWTAGKPNYVRTRARENHKDNSRWQESYLYSDGFGREVQTKVQAEPGDANKIDINGKLVTEHTNSRWVGTGRTIFNNKGKPVKQYEPFFSHTHHYEHEAAMVEWGVTPVLFYDPLERVICTIHPNDTYAKVIFDPWQQISWDVNDTILLDPRTDNDINGYTADFLSYHDAQYTADHPGQTPQTWYQHRINGTDAAEKDAAIKTAKHAATPGIAYLDSLGRTFLTVADNGKDANGNSQLLKTRVKLDIEGNELEITDPRNIKAFQHRFDIAGRKIFVNSVDAGRSAVLTDIAGNPIRSQDANGNVVRIVYDELRRPIEVWVTEGSGREYLAEKTIYGEAIGNTAENTNHRGQAWKIYDGAGRVANKVYDFKGNLLISARRLLINAKSQVKWPLDGSGGFDENQAIRLLKSGADYNYATENKYDALNRVTSNKIPDGTVVIPEYNEAGLLNAVKVNNRGGVAQTFVNNIDYNARGQRTEIVYGNKVKSTYGYDSFTFRLVKLVSTRKRNSPEKLQNLSYTYDPLGNITQIRDDSVVARPIWHAQRKIEPVCRYAYDPVYRLISAEGREHKSMTPSHYRDPSACKQSVYLKGPPHPNDTTALQMYEELYSYDASGNIEKIEHKRITNGTRNTSWTRTQNYERVSNRIDTSKCNSQQQNLRDDLFTISHDDNGNILNLQPQKRRNRGEEQERQLGWNYKNQLVSVVLDKAGNKVFYQYDASGQRVRKCIVKNSGTCIEERIYLGGYEIYTKKNGSNAPVRRDTIHVMDDKNRIALIENEVKSNSVDTRIRYQLNNHLGSSILEVDETDVDETDPANIITYEEYYPYGGTSYVAGISVAEVSRKRYRCGKERDDETGLYYYGARYYAPWLGRWISCDPIGISGGTNEYRYTSGNPLRFTDQSGMQENITPAEEAAQECYPSLHICQDTTAIEETLTCDANYSYQEQGGMSESEIETGILEDTSPAEQLAKQCDPYLHEPATTINEEPLSSGDDSLKQEQSKAEKGILDRVSDWWEKFKTEWKKDQAEQEKFMKEMDERWMRGARAHEQMRREAQRQLLENIGLLPGTTKDTTQKSTSGKKARDSSKAERHGDSGRALEKAEKQIEELERKLQQATGREAKKIKQKIQNIRRAAQKDKKGDTHWKRGK